MKTLADLDDYQITGANWLARGAETGTGFAALGDDPGLGKTAQAIRALDILGHRRALIICPAAVRHVWPSEFQKWGQMDRRVLLMDESVQLGAWFENRFDVGVCSYEFAKKHKKFIAEEYYPALVIDEAHYLKNKLAARTKAIYGVETNRYRSVAGSAGHVFALSGTFMTNTPLDLYSLLRASGVYKGTVTEFERAFFQVHWEGNKPTLIVRDRDLPELRELVKRVVLRRSISLLNLPPMRMTTLDIAGDQTEILSLLREFPGLDRAILDAVEAGNVSFLDAQHIGTLRRLTAEAKAPGFAEYLAETIAGGLDKAVVMGTHVKALSIIRDVLEARGVKVVMLTGQTPNKERGEVVDQFQNGDAQVLIGNMITAGTGHTMTSSRMIYMFETDWVPATNAQALGRIKRKGQTRSMLATFVGLKDSVDQQVAKRVAEKTEQIMRVDPSAFA